MHREWVPICAHYLHCAFFCEGASNSCCGLRCAVSRWPGRPVALIGWLNTGHFVLASRCGSKVVGFGGCAFIYLRLQSWPTCKRNGLVGRSAWVVTTSTCSCGQRSILPAHLAVDLLLCTAWRRQQQAAACCLPCHSLFPFLLPNVNKIEVKEWKSRILPESADIVQTS